MAKVYPLTHGFSGVVSADSKESLLSVPIQVRAVGYPLAFRPRQSPALPCPEALTSPNTCPLQCAGKGRFTQHSSSCQQASQDLDPCSLQTYRDRSVSLPCSVGPAGLDVEQSKKTPVFCFQCFLLPWRVGRRTISKPSVLALQLVISMCSFELLEPALLPGCLCGDEASERGSVYSQPRCQGIKCLPLCPLLHLWIII